LDGLRQIPEAEWVHAITLILSPKVVLQKAHNACASMAANPGETGRPCGNDFALQMAAPPLRWWSPHLFSVFPRGKNSPIKLFIVGPAKGQPRASL